MQTSELRRNSSDELPRVLVIVGPTAIGKTEFAVRVGERFTGEIVSADSRQVYRFMDIGTAKPTAEQRARVPHHLLDLVNPDESFTLAQYQEWAYRAIQGVAARGKLPLLVGGTGLYVRAVTEGWTIPHVAPDPRRRAALYREANEQGAETLYARLREIDPVAALKIDPRNVRRVIRALEVYAVTGEPISALQSKTPPPYRFLTIGLTTDRARLYERIDRRVDAMLAAGLIEEVKALVERGYGLDLPAMSGLGYRQIGLYLQGQVSLEEAVRLIKRETRRFVRHQYSWFRLTDPRIRWFDVEQTDTQAILRSIALDLTGLQKTCQV